MNKKELVSRLESLVTQYIEEFKVEAKHWEQKYYIAYQTNLKLEEQNKVLTQEKQALLDVVADWKSENQSLAALNETLSGELATLKKEEEQLTQACKNWQENYILARRELAGARGARDTYYQEKLDQGKIIANLAAEVVELKKELAEAKERWPQQMEYADKYAAKLVVLKEELAEKESSWSKAFAAAEERYEDFKKRSDGILATMGENLQRKQEQIEALTTWKEGTEKVLDSMVEKLKDYETTSKVYEETIEMLTKQKGELEAQLEALKQINSFQEHRIEVLSRKARKLRKKEQND